MLRNLKEIHRAAEDWPRLLTVQDRLVVLLPQAWEERRDRGLARAELGLGESAATDLAAYLANAHGADDHAAISERLAGMGGPGSSRLH